jgi:uncharacterized protein YbcI
MKIKYKIVWLDDQPETMKKYLDDIKLILEENYFIPDIQKPYISYENFQQSFQTTSNNDIYGEVFNDCDLLLIDLNIAEKQENEGKTGATLISQLRSKGIYTETVFYSNAMDEYRRNPNKPELDNVIYADKNELIGKVEKLIKKQVVQSMIISNLRGYLMDCTSDFDFICRNVSEYFFGNLNEEQQLKVLKKAEEYIHNQYKSENKKFEEINNKYKGIINYSDFMDKTTFHEISNNVERMKKIRKVFSSLESVMIVRDKFRLMALILEMNGITSYSEIYSAVPKDSKKNESEQDKYYEIIIKNRNKLAHNKLIYGSKCKNRIKIVEFLEDMICCCEETECEKSYSYDDCMKLRENIFKYYLLFNPLLEQVMENKQNG